MHDVEILIYRISISFLFLKGVNIMNEIIKRENVVIEDIIYEVREIQVMSEVPELYKILAMNYLQI